MFHVRDVTIWLDTCLGHRVKVSVRVRGTKNVPNPILTISFDTSHARNAILILYYTQRVINLTLSG